MKFGKYHQLFTILKRQLEKCIQIILCSCIKIEIYRMYGFDLIVHTSLSFFEGKNET